MYPGSDGHSRTGSPPVVQLGLRAICVWNCNWWLTQYHFLIKHWSWHKHRCSPPVVGLEEYSLRLVSHCNTVRSGTLTWREWGLWLGELYLPTPPSNFGNDGIGKFWCEPPMTFVDPNINSILMISKYDFMFSCMVGYCLQCLRSVVLCCLSLMWFQL